jgi:pimeloyl-ACP methyl ester carboxylesterase
MTQSQPAACEQPVEQPDCAITAGDRSDPLVVLLHGAGASAEIWDDHLRLLSDQYRVVAVDLPGHRDHPAETFTYERAVATVRDVVAAEGQPAVLVGHSVGGYVAGRVVEQHPGMVEAVVTSGSYVDWRRGKGLLLSALYGSVFAPAIKLGRYSDRWKDVVVDGLTLDEYETDTVSEDTLTGGASAMQASAFADVWRGVEGFDGPVLVGAGREEPLVEDYGPALAERAGGTFEYMPFDGHNGPVTHPEAFVSVVDRFVREHDVAAPERRDGRNRPTSTTRPASP